MVTKIHVQAEKLKADGYKIIVIGDPNHPEVKGTLSHVPGAWCIEDVDDVAKLPRASRVGVVVQSTWSGERLYRYRAGACRRSTTKFVRSTRSAPIRTTASTKPRVWRKRSK